MKIISILTNRARLQKVAGGVALGVVLMASVAASARPDNVGHQRGDGGHGAVDRDWDRHAEGAHRYWGHPHIAPEPQVIYAPPVVYAPPEYYAPPAYEQPGINLIIPFNIR